MQTTDIEIEREARAKAEAERDAWKRLAQAWAAIAKAAGGSTAEAVKVGVGFHEAYQTLRALGIDPEAP